MMAQLLKKQTSKMETTENSCTPQTITKSMQGKTSQNIPVRISKKTFLFPSSTSRVSAACVLKLWVCIYIYMDPLGTQSIYIIIQVHRWLFACHVRDMYSGYNSSSFKKTFFVCLFVFCFFLLVFFSSFPYQLMLSQHKKTPT